MVIYGTSTQWYYILTLQQVRLEIQLSLKKKCVGLQQAGITRQYQKPLPQPLCGSALILFISSSSPSQPIVNNQPVIDFSVSLSWVCERPAIAVLKVPYIPDCFFFNLKLKLKIIFP